MGNDFTAEQVENAANVGEIIAVVQEEIGCLKVRSMPPLCAPLLPQSGTGHAFCPATPATCPVSCVSSFLTAVPDEKIQQIILPHDSSAARQPSRTRTHVSCTHASPREVDVRSVSGFQLL